ncbi:hypothetical protein HDV05_007246 [Chytridiales sp. JEL 0842]|nr:hypothetical protein HDV05_007246 [Chytridiales sp. JEL 0842]
MGKPTRPNLTLAIPTPTATTPSDSSPSRLPHELAVKCLAVIASILEFKRKDILKCTAILSERGNKPSSSTSNAVQDIFIKAFQIQGSSNEGDKAHGQEGSNFTLKAYDSWADSVIENLARYNSVDAEEAKALKAHGIYDTYLKAHSSALQDAIQSFGPALTDPSYCTQTQSLQQSFENLQILYNDVAILIISNLFNACLSANGNATNIDEKQQQHKLTYDARLRHVVHHLISIILDFSHLSNHHHQPLTSLELKERDRSQAKIIHRVERMIGFLLLSQAQDGNSIDTSGLLLTPALQTVFGNSSLQNIPRPLNATSGADSDGQSTDTTVVNSGSVEDDVGGNSSKGGGETKIPKWVRRSLEVSGGVLANIKNGMTTPLLTTSFGALFSGSISDQSAAQGNAPESAIIGSFFAAKRGSDSGPASKSSKPLAGYDEYSFREVASQEAALTVIIALSGWYEHSNDYDEVWSSLTASAPYSEIMSFVYDHETLLTFGRSMKAFLSTAAAANAERKRIKRQSVTEGMDPPEPFRWPEELLRMTVLLEKPWIAGLERAKRAGEVFAKEVLLKRVHGMRPISLIAWGLGCRVIFFALLELVRLGETDKSAFGIVDSIYFFGAPVEINVDAWLKISTIVSGRIVNAYSKSDWFLYFLHRSDTHPAPSIAGLSPIEITSANNNNFENYDFSHLVLSHLSWKESLPELLDLVRFDRSPKQCMQIRNEKEGLISNTADGELTCEVLWEADEYLDEEECEKDKSKSTPTPALKDCENMKTSFVLAPSLTTRNRQPWINNNTHSAGFIPRSVQLSPASANEPEALVLTPLPREVSLDGIAEDEEDRRQAETWVGADIEM